MSERVAIRAAFPFHLPDLDSTFFAVRHDPRLVSFSRLVSAGTRTPTSKGTGTGHESYNYGQPKAT